MESVQKVADQLEDLCTSIRHFKTTYLEDSTYSSPIIDHHSPDHYNQRAIVGIGKFLGQAENERDHVQAILDSGRPPKELTTNTPNLIAVWHEAQRAPWPLVSIAQQVECGTEGQMRVDVVAEGGDLWVKVNTIKEARLMAEFREQDSYINSDYDDDSEEDETGPAQPAPGLTNSIITQAQTLLRAAKATPRPLGSSVPRIRYVLNRMEEHPENGYSDERVSETFEAVRAMGVELVLGTKPIPPITPRPRARLLPTKQIMLDLSVIVALCCDSTHFPLPTSTDELEARFRFLERDSTGETSLAEHTNASKDLRDQLSWEISHPVIEEIQSRLSSYKGEELEWFVSKEVRDRTPGIVDLIGGPREQARARALYDGSSKDFWAGSRYEWKEGILRNLKVQVLDDDIDSKLALLDLKEDRSMFDKGLMAVCERMLSVVEGDKTPSKDSTPPVPVYVDTKRRRILRSKNAKNRPNAVFPPPQRLPSRHTLRTLVMGVKRGMTVLTNNRGAVGKVVREMGAHEGLPFDERDDGCESRRAVVWVVNPSSLAEWRRLEVEQSNENLLNGHDRDDLTK